MKKIFLIIISVLFLLSNFLYSDMGAIVPKESVKVNEPGQKAIIAYDGFEEILILSTDLSTNSKNKIIRFIPFPSKPQIIPVKKDCFKNLEKIINKHKISFLVHYKMMSPKKHSSNFKIELYKKIGAHEITLLYVKNLEMFITWINDFFKKLGYYNKTLSKNEINVIESYLKRNFNYFVFDVVNLDKNVKTISPILYSFKSNFFYYPLLTSNLMNSNGEIILFVISENGHIKLNYPWQHSTTAVLDKNEMKLINEKISELMGKHAILQVFRYRGKLKFSNDIIIKSPVKHTSPYYPKLKIKN